MTMPYSKKEKIIWDYLELQTKTKNVNIINLTLNEMKKQCMNMGITEKDILNILENYKKEECVSEEEISFTIYFPKSNKRNIPKFFVENFAKRQSSYFIFAFLILSFLVANEAFFVHLLDALIDLEKPLDSIVLQQLFLSAMLFGSIGSLVLGVIIYSVFDKLKNVLVARIPFVKKYYSLNIIEPFILVFLILSIIYYFCSVAFAFSVDGSHIAVILVGSFGAAIHISSQLKKQKQELERIIYIK